MKRITFASFFLAACFLALLFLQNYAFSHPNHSFSGNWTGRLDILEIVHKQNRLTIKGKRKNGSQPYTIHFGQVPGKQKIFVGRSRSNVSHVLTFISPYTMNWYWIDKQGKVSGSFVYLKKR